MNRKQKREQARQATTEGGTVRGRRQAGRAARQGGLTDDGRVVDGQGRQRGNFRGRTPRPPESFGRVPNRNGV